MKAAIAFGGFTTALWFAALGVAVWRHDTYGAAVMGVTAGALLMQWLDDIKKAKRP